MARVKAKCELRLSRDTSCSNQQLEFYCECAILEEREKVRKSVLLLLLRSSQTTITYLQTNKLTINSMFSQIVIGLTYCSFSPFGLGSQRHPLL